MRSIKARENAVVVNLKLSFSHPIPLIQLITSYLYNNNQITKHSQSEKMHAFFCFILVIIAGSLIAPCIEAKASPSEGSLETIGDPLDVGLLQSTICFTELNRERTNNGLQPVTVNLQVEQAAYNHNAHMITNNCFSHQCPGEPGLGDRLSATGYRWGGVGEIIAAGQRDCASVVSAWMNSSGHRAIILTPGYRHVGCSGLTCSGCSNPGPWWTCVFASPL